MDPNQTVQDLLVALKTKDRDAAVEALAALQHWLDRGGFLPDCPKGAI